MAAIVDLNHPAHTVHWQVFQMPVADVVVVVAMVVVFIAAVAVPFPSAMRGWGQATSSDAAREPGAPR